MSNKNDPYEILCYGDSNTWGTIAKWNVLQKEGRYDRNTRWPCILQKELGQDYAVTEEGLGGRTTVYNAQPESPYKNGLYMFDGVLRSHRPIDLVILMLGTNDLHMSERLPEERLDAGMRQLVDIVQHRPECGRGGERAPAVLIIAPTAVIPSSPEGRTEVYAAFFGEYGERLSRRFPEVYGKLAEEMGCYFLNAQEYAHADPGDGVHITGDSHIRLGKAVAEKVRQIRAAEEYEKRKECAYEGR